MGVHTNISKAEQAARLASFRKSSVYKSIMRVKPPGRNSDAWEREQAQRWYEQGGRAGKERKATALEARNGYNGKAATGGSTLAEAFLPGIHLTPKTATPSTYTTPGGGKVTANSGDGVYNANQPKVLRTYANAQGHPVNKANGKFTGRGKSGYAYTQDLSGNNGNTTPATARTRAGRFAPNNQAYNGHLRAQNNFTRAAQTFINNGGMPGARHALARAAGTLGSLGWGTVMGGAIIAGNEAIDHIVAHPGQRGFVQNEDGTLTDYMGSGDTRNLWNYRTQLPNGNWATDFGKIASNNHFLITPEDKLAYYLGDPRQLSSGAGASGVAMGKRMAREYLTPDQARRIANAPTIFNRLPPNIQERVRRLVEEDTVNRGELPGVEIVARRPTKPAPRAKKPAPAPYVPVGPMEAIPMGPMPNIAPGLSVGLPKPVAPAPQESGWVKRDPWTGIAGPQRPSVPVQAAPGSYESYFPEEMTDEDMYYENMMKYGSPNAPYMK